MGKTKKIIIIGGGIGGAATALALNRAGFHISVYERAQELREVGAGIALWANATHVLNELGLLKDAVNLGCLTTNYQFNTQDGKELVNVSVDKFELPVIGIHRADLHKLLWSNYPGKFVLGQTFERFEQDGSLVRVYMKSGLQDEGDALIGADGLRSQVRAALFGENPPIYRNFTTWRGLTNYIPKAYIPGYIHEFLGRGKGFGFMLLGNNRIYWYAAAKAKEGQGDIKEGRKHELEVMFQDWKDVIPELIAATDEASIIKTDLYGRVPTRPWAKGNITLLGDAAHPMLPTLGQGACTALEDALVISKCLQGECDVVRAFEQYELQRGARVKSIVEQSLRSARMGELENPIAVGLRNQFMKLIESVIADSFKTCHSFRA
ncbi:monooxygenase FAD-binding protein [Calothrix sp. NIES-4071]|nr:monooxygenase FAD-binding protein [Calothrix sp. NIES-4071]BAZ58021.1 monooxygenase FAD-binding protein [Calothrix sp. NIES-4105]